MPGTLSPEVLEDMVAMSLARCIAADTYQDAMRIKLRQDPNSACTIFLPIRCKTSTA